MSDDPTPTAAAAEADDLQPLRPGPPPHPAATLVGGFLMGSADIVPGVSGGTIALVLGIYERLVEQVSAGAAALGVLVRGDLRGALSRARHVQWTFVLPLGVGILTAIGLLSSLLEHLLEAQPVLLSGLFLGLVAGSVVIALRRFRSPPAAPQWTVMVVTAVVVFALLGLRSGRVADPSLLVFVVGGAVAVCAMILPGVSGSFLLLLLGLYDAVIAAVSGRDLAVVASVGLGAVVGLAVFSTLLHWLLEHHHDVVLAVLVGLMAGSLRVLWPWPAGPDGVGDTALGAPDGQVLGVVALAVVGVLVVVGIAGLGERYARAPTA